MKSPKVVGVLLFNEAYEHLSDALKSYLQKGSIGNYIYGLKAEQDGAFLNVTVSPEQVDGRIRETMMISIPLRFVKFVVSAPSKDFIGFA